MHTNYKIFQDTKSLAELMPNKITVKMKFKIVYETHFKSISIVFIILTQTKLNFREKT